MKIRSRIFTYPNPLEINKNNKLWGIITYYPHFCASDTLMQGLETVYKRKSFGILRTVDSLIEKVMGEFVKNPQNDIQMFLDVANIIRDDHDGIRDEKLKKAFRFNIGQVVESIKFLLLMDCEDKFDEKFLTTDQKYLIKIYKNIKREKTAEHLNRIKQMKKNEFVEKMKCVINEEIKFMLHDDEFAEIKAKYNPARITKLEDGRNAITAIIEYLTEKSLNPPSIFEKPKSYKLENAKHILSLIEDDDMSKFDKIIIHGVHRITPQMYFMFKLMDSLGIEIIFLINYAKNIPNTYRTWKEVYEWCGTDDFEFLSNLDMSTGNELGVSISNIIEGKKVIKKPNKKVIKYKNLTSFTDGEVRRTFKSAGKLNKMETQYYGVRGSSSNELLKIYFPEQFGQKPFLSYPIGQFILNIYKMWDFKNKNMILDTSSLYECAVSNIYRSNINVNLPDVIIRIKLYFSDIETFEDYDIRILRLEKSINMIKNKEKHESLKKLSFFNVSLEELSEFRRFVDMINKTSTQLFYKTNNEIDYGKHFKVLVDIISTNTKGRNTISDTESKFIKEISGKLSGFNEDKIKGNIEDVKDALSFYLSANINDDTSNWIVRDFQQIDGAVLLSKECKAKKYHFALLSNNQMLKQPDDVLPWPLSVEMFNNYTDMESAIPIINKGLLEMSNFLRFMLFYGTFFSKCNIEFSYIEEENDKKQVMYYLFKVLGLESEDFNEKYETNFNTNIVKENNLLYNMKDMNKKDKKLFSICPYKFLLKTVLKSEIEYKSEYQVKYYVTNFMYFLIGDNYDLSENGIFKNIESEFNNIKEFFPFWDKAKFSDILKDAKNQISIDINKIKSGSNLNNYREEYRWKKENFLIAQWTDMETNEKFMNYNKPDWIILKYLKSNQLYPKLEELPYEKVCEDCNFNDICLRYYYKAYSYKDKINNI